MTQRHQHNSNWLVSKTPHKTPKKVFCPLLVRKNAFCRHNVKGHSEKRQNSKRISWKKNIFELKQARLFPSACTQSCWGKMAKTQKRPKTWKDFNAWRYFAGCVREVAHQTRNLGFICLSREETWPASWEVATFQWFFSPNNEKYRETERNTKETPTCCEQHAENLKRGKQKHVFFVFWLSSLERMAKSFAACVSDVNSRFLKTGPTWVSIFVSCILYPFKTSFRWLMCLTASSAAGKHPLPQLENGPDSG